jgi:hypothetical protein
MCNKKGVFDEVNARFVNQEGRIKLLVCSRGCTQPVIETTLKDQEVLLIPQNLEDRFKTNGLGIRFTGKLLANTGDLYMPGSDDIPRVMGEAQMVEIERIVKK